MPILIRFTPNPDQVYPRSTPGPDKPLIGFQPIPTWFFEIPDTKTMKTISISQRVAAAVNTLARGQIRGAHAPSRVAEDALVLSPERHDIERRTIFREGAKNIHARARVLPVAERPHDGSRGFQATIHRIIRTFVAERRLKCVQSSSVATRRGRMGAFHRGMNPTATVTPSL